MNTLNSLNPSTPSNIQNTPNVVNGAYVPALPKESRSFGSRLTTAFTSARQRMKEPDIPVPKSRVLSVDAILADLADIALRSVQQARPLSAAAIASILVYFLYSKWSVSIPGLWCAKPDNADNIFCTFVAAWITQIIGASVLLPTVFAVPDHFRTLAFFAAMFLVFVLPESSVWQFGAQGVCIYIFASARNMYTRFATIGVITALWFAGFYITPTTDPASGGYAPVMTHAHAWRISHGVPHPEARAAAAALPVNPDALHDKILANKPLTTAELAYYTQHLHDTVSAGHTHEHAAGGKHYVRKHTHHASGGQPAAKGDAAAKGAGSPPTFDKTRERA